jgi:N-acetylglucosaminyldiphosphoundecaprenol N-acetyl-beta-D-mannosaminyltransferase
MNGARHVSSGELELAHPAHRPGSLPVQPASTDGQLRGGAAGTPARSRPPIAILGVLLDNVTTAEAIQRIESMIASGHPHYVVTANADFLVQASSDVELRRILLDAHLALCDGTPVLWATRLLGNPLPERVAGSDLVPLLISRAAEKQYRIFFLGSAPERAEAAMGKLRQQHPSLVIAGHYSPPFSSLLEMDHEEIARRIKEAKPDLLFVCFGCPKQEKWISMHYRDLGVPVSIGVGGTLDFLAGTLKRAPLWMQRTGTEWIFRLAQEPRRLFRRYMNDLWVFGKGVLLQWCRMGSRRRSLHIAKIERDTALPPPVNGEPRPEFQLIRMPARVDWALVDANPTLLADLNTHSGHCLLQMAGVTFMDSTGVGFLIKLQKAMNESGRCVVLVSPSRAARRALTTMRLLEFFPTADSIAAAQALVAESGTITWRGEITAANASQVWSHTERSLAEVNGSWIIDLSAVRFIDSTGLGVMIRAAKLARQQQKSLVFTNSQPAVRNVVRLANLDRMLVLVDRAPVTGEGQANSRLPLVS